MSSGTRSTCRSRRTLDRKSTRLNSSHLVISYAVFCLKKKKQSRTSTIFVRCARNKLMISQTEARRAEPVSSSAAHHQAPAELHVRQLNFLAAVLPATQ